MRQTCDLILVERALRRTAIGTPTVVDGRDDVYGVIAGQVGDAPVTYLEFGVHEGRSLEFFVSNLRHPDARFHGFDSFEGLPEMWNEANPRGTFSTEGRAPVLSDDRATLHVGWFAETLPDFSLERRGMIVLNIDCDLYSSTTTVLEWARLHLESGDLIYFDEFADISHEFRAFEDFRLTVPIEFELISRSSTWMNVLLRVR